MNNLDNLINQLESRIEFAENLNQKISQANAGWHIEHSLMTINGITDFLINSDPDDYKWKFNLTRIAVLTIRKIPRGRAKSPEEVQPGVNINNISLQKHISETRKKIQELEFISKDKYFEHPYFGKLKLEQTINFLEIHTIHHLEIIKDILNDNKE